MFPELLPSNLTRCNGCLPEKAARKMSVKHYSTIIDGQIDGELPLSVAPYGFGTPVNTSNDGNTPLALEVFHGTSTDNPTQSNVSLPFLNIYLWYKYLINI